MANLQEIMSNGNSFINANELKELKKRQDLLEEKLEKIEKIMDKIITVLINIEKE